MEILFWSPFLVILQLPRRETTVPINTIPIKLVHSLAGGRIWARFRCLLSTLILSDFESMLFAHAISRYPCNSELQIWSIAAHLAISCSFLLLTVCQEGRTTDWLIICHFHRLLVFRIFSSDLDWNYFDWKLLVSAILFGSLLELVKWEGLLTEIV